VREDGVDGFIGRVQAAETLSEYFFGHISSELNLSEMEGRAQLINKAKPYLEKLPDSVFKEMMFARLKELSGWGGLDVLENATTLASKQSPRQNPRIGRKQSQNNKSARTAIALLVQNPRLAELVEQRNIDWNGLEFSGVELFKKILSVIADKNPSNTAVLVECYRDTADEKSIKALALLDFQLSDDGIETEFCGALDTLLTQAREAVLARLLNKGKMDAQEKELLRKTLAAKSLVQKNRNL